MNAIELLEYDHRHVKELFAHCEAAPGPDRGRILRSIADELRMHSMVEEEIFYPAVRETNDETLQELVNESLDEHRSVAELLEDLEGMPADDDEFPERIAMLQGDVEQHVEEEETEMFPRLRKIWDEAYLARLGQGMWELKQQRKAA